MDEAAFVDALIAALPEAFPDRERYVYEDGMLSYPALGDALIWLEDHAIRIRLLPRRAFVRRGREDAMRRFWDFVEEQAVAGAGDTELENLLAIECFEGVGWVEDLGEYLGPRTRELLAEAQVTLASANGQIGRWADDSQRR
jgi:hypothetical protein